MAEATSTQKWENELEKRPGLVTFAAVMLFILGGFQILSAIAEFVRATWVAFNVAGTIGGPLWLWGLIDIAFALIAWSAAADLMRGGIYGRVMGIAIATLSALRWFFYLPAVPVTAVVMIAVDLIILYGLAVHGEYFRSAQSHPAPR